MQIADTVQWDAYPVPQVNPQTPKVELTNGLFYVNGFEQYVLLASCVALRIMTVIVQQNSIDNGD